MLYNIYIYRIFTYILYDTSMYQKLDINNYGRSKKIGNNYIIIQYN